MAKNRRGRFTAKDGEYLRANATKMSVEDMAAHLKRDPATVAEWLSKRGIKNSAFYDTDEDRARIKGELVSEPFWLNVREQFTEREQQYFVSQYCEHIVQMEKLASVEYTEKMQLMHLIRNEIIMDRVLTRQKRAHTQAVEADSKLEELADKTGPDAEVQKKRLREIIQQCEYMFSSFTKEQKEIQDKINQLRRELKMTREQRVKDFNSVTKDFEGLVKKLNDHKFRADEGKELAVFRAAMEVERARLSEWHEYADGKKDIPLLTPEVIDRIERNAESAS